MSKKYFIIYLLMALVICVSLSTAIASEDTYSVNIEGINFNIPNNFQVKGDFIFEDDTTTFDKWGNDLPAHYKSIDYTDGQNTITITVTTSYGEPFGPEDAAPGGEAKTTIANKTGSISKSSGDVAFWYVEDGKLIMIETLMEKNNIDFIEKCIGT